MATAEISIHLDRIQVRKVRRNREGATVLGLELVERRAEGLGLEPTTLGLTFFLDDAKAQALAEAILVVFPGAAPHVWDRDAQPEATEVDPDQIEMPMAAE